ncbi:MAG: alginate lyase [Marivirga sp.]|nr:alginate lyase [Marivirga sp.]
MKLLFYIVAIFHTSHVFAQDDFEKDVMAELKDEILLKANAALNEKPVTVTAFVSPRSAGGIHDFFSEGDYWWPDPGNPNGPYIQRDGQTNPDNFVDHRKAMIRLSQIVGSLASAYIITKDERFAVHAFSHARAWFSDTTTMMNPSLNFAQAIKGRATGRGIGIIDTIHLIEVAQGLSRMQNSSAADKKILMTIKDWFSKYLAWLTSHQYGVDEMNAKNNHGTCWVMQVAAFAKFVENEKLTEFCKDRYKTVLLPNQMADDGSFPQELRRTKPYGYSLFNLDAMVMICKILSDHNDNLWRYQTKDGKSIEKGIRFLYPYIQNKSRWSFKEDVMYWEAWPIAHPLLLFGAIEFKNRSWFETWEDLDHFPEVGEVVRNVPIRSPLIWLNE